MWIAAKLASASSLSLHRLVVRQALTEWDHRRALCQGTLEHVDRRDHLYFYRWTNWGPEMLRDLLESHSWWVAALRPSLYGCGHWKQTNVPPRRFAFIGDRASFSFCPSRGGSVRSTYRSHRLQWCPLNWRLRICSFTRATLFSLWQGDGLLGPKRLRLQIGLDLLSWHLFFESPIGI